MYTERGNKPIHLAALYGHLEIVKYLVQDMKCDPNIPNLDGHRCIHAVVRNGYLEILKYLVEELKCDLNPPCQSEIEPLIHLAVNAGQLEIISKSENRPKFSK